MTRKFRTSALGGSGMVSEIPMKDGQDTLAILDESVKKAAYLQSSLDHDGEFQTPDTVPSSFSDRKVIKIIQVNSD